MRSKQWIWLAKLGLVVLILAAVALLHVPQVLQGERLIQGDKLHFVAATHSLKEIHEKTGKLPHWSNDMYAGMPANFIYSKYPSNLVSVALQEKFLPNELKVFLLPCLFIWLALVLVGTDWFIALLSALAYGFTTVAIGNIEAGHSAKVQVLGTIVPLLVGTHAVFNRKIWAGFLIVALFTAINIASNHLQITYYSMLVIALMVLAEVTVLVRKRFFGRLIKALGVLSLAVFIGLLPNVSMLWSGYRYSQETVRGKQILQKEAESESGLSKTYINEYSHSFMELLSMIVPHATGGSSSEILGRESASFKVLSQTGIEPQRKSGSQVKMPLFWGDKPLNGAPTYIGVLFFCLFCISIVGLSRKQKIIVTVMLLFAILIVLGGNAGFVSDLFYNYLPLYKKFRAPSMAMGVVSAIMAYAIALGLANLFRDESLLFKFRKQLTVSTAVLAGVLLLLAIVGPSLFSFSWDWGADQMGSGMDDSIRSRMLEYGYPEGSVNAFFKALNDDRAHVFRTDAFRSGFLVVLFLGLLTLVFRGLMKFKYALALTATFAVAELYLVNHHYLNEDDFAQELDFEKLYPETESVRHMKQLSSGYERMVDVTTNTWADARPAYYMPTIGGMHGARLRRFQDLIDRNLNSELGALRNRKQVAETPVMNMLNTRFIKTGPRAFDYLENITALGSAWFVDSIKWVSDPHSEIESLKTVSLASSAVIQSEFKSMVSNLKSTPTRYSSIELQKKTPFEVVYHTVSDQPELMIMSEMWYKGNDYWRSTIDGDETGHIRVNYALRGISVPKGEHTVRFEYHDKAFEKSEPMAAMGSGILILSVIVSGFFMFRTANTETDIRK